jgi:hypothetical protein
MKKTSVTIFMPFEALEGDLYRNVAHCQVHLTGPYSGNAHPPRALAYTSYIEEKTCHGKWLQK